MQTARSRSKMAGLTLGRGGGGGVGQRAAPQLSRGPSPLDGDPGRSPVGVHHLLQLVVEDKLRVPGERALSQQAHPDSRATGGPTSLGTWRGKGAPQVCACTRLPPSLLGKDRALFSTNVFPVAFWGIL